MTRSRSNFEQNSVAQEASSGQIRESDVPDGQNNGEYVFSSDDNDDDDDDDSYSESSEEYSSDENMEQNGNPAKPCVSSPSHPTPLPSFSGQTFSSVPVMHDFTQSHRMYVQNQMHPNHSLVQPYSNGLTTSVNNNGLYQQQSIVSYPQVMYDPHQYLSSQVREQISRQPLQLSCHQQPIPVSSSCYSHSMLPVQSSQSCLVLRHPPSVSAPLSRPALTVTDDHDYTDLSQSINCQTVSSGVVNNHYNNHFLVKNHSLQTHLLNNGVTESFNGNAALVVSDEGNCQSEGRDECLGQDHTLGDIVTNSIVDPTVV